MLGLTACDRSKPTSQPANSASHATFAVTPPIPTGSKDGFEDVTAASGITFVQQFCDERIANILESNGSGAAILDYDNDGWMDIYLVNPGPLDGVTHHQPGTRREPNRLYRNRGNGTFEDVTDQAGVAGSGYSLAAAAADYDNDGFADLYLVNAGSNILYHNRGDGTFENVTAKAGVGDKGTGIGAVFFDADNDGKLDLLVANYLTYDPNNKLYYNPDAYPGPLSYKAEFNCLFRNQGDGTFTDISEKSGVRLPGHRAMSVCAFDYNDDGATDLYVCNDATPNLLLVNDGQGNFRNVAATSHGRLQCQRRSGWLDDRGARRLQRRSTPRPAGVPPGLRLALHRAARRHFPRPDDDLGLGRAHRPIRRLGQQLPRSGQ